VKAAVRKPATHRNQVHWHLLASAPSDHQRMPTILEAVDFEDHRVAEALSTAICGFAHGEPRGQFLRASRPGYFCLQKRREFAPRCQADIGRTRTYRT
jgi:hypothetical protein